LRLTAPVNAPLSWPNSSLSSSDVGMAAQFTRINGPFARGLAKWMPSATSSLPVPLSPRIKTVVCPSAALAATASASRTMPLRPTNLLKATGGFFARRSSCSRYSARAVALVSLSMSAWTSDMFLTTDTTPATSLSMTIGFTLATIVCPFGLRLMLPSTGLPVSKALDLAPSGEIWAIFWPMSRSGGVCVILT
jgi:hypothetical protein